MLRLDDDVKDVDDGKVDVDGVDLLKKRFIDIGTIRGVFY